MSALLSPNEDFIHFIWKFTLFDISKLRTTNGEPVRILNCGRHNFDAGPDFFNARIKIGSTQWAGNVEIHRKSSDWRKHKHTQDEAYANVILHVVWEHDETVFTAKGEPVPEIEIGHLVAKSALKTYKSIADNLESIPCHAFIKGVDGLTLRNWLERLNSERLADKTLNIKKSLEANKYNWEQTFYELLAGAFGTKLNTEPFVMLARSLPHRLLAKYKANVFQLEALLFGQSGMLQTCKKDDYVLALQKEYRYLAAKHRLKPMDGFIWKFARLRPLAFPTIRVAQFAALVHKSSHLFAHILETEQPKDLRALFSVTASAYWDIHYRFGVISAPKTKTFGQATIRILLINTVVPFLFLYGKLRQGDEEYAQKSINLLEFLPSEQNKTVKQFVDLGVKIDNSLHSQGLLQLQKNYCYHKKCLQCAIGAKILKQHVSTNSQLY